MVQRWAIVAVCLVGCSTPKTVPSSPPLPPTTPVETAPTPVPASSPVEKVLAPVAPVTPSVVSGPVLPVIAVATPSEFPSVDAQGMHATGVTPEPDTDPDDDPLARAAEFWERGDRRQAARSLETYVERHPRQFLFRVHLAELLLNLGEEAAARAHFERFLEEARRATGPVRGYRVHAHTRLMEIAQRTGDRVMELSHRGCGLLELWAESDDQPDRDAGFQEEILCQAIKALREARRLGSRDPRLAEALAEVYERTKNPLAAEAERSVLRHSFVPTGRRHRIPLP